MKIPKSTWSSWRVYWALVVLTLTMMGAMAYILYSGNRMAVKHSSLIEASMGIKLDLTTAHLWFEEIFNGGREVILDDVWRYLESAEWNAQAILEIVNNSRDWFTFPKNPDIDRQAPEVWRKIGEFKNLTRDLWVSRSLPDKSPDLDIKHDILFKDIIRMVDKLTTNIQQNTISETKFFKQLQISLILGVGLLSLLVGLVFAKYITAGKQAETARTASENRYRAILEYASDGIVIVNSKGLIEIANSMTEKMFGYTREELLGLPVDILVPDPKKEIHANHRKNFLANPQPRSMGRGNNLTARRKNGAHFPVEVSLSYVKADTGTLIVAFITDISERKIAEQQAKLQQQQLIQADKMATLGILVSGVAHEINNPTSFILLNGKIFYRVWNDVIPILQHYYKTNGEFTLAGMPFTRANKKIAQLISGVIEGAARIEIIVQSLKDFAKQDTGDLNQNVNINSIVKSAIVIVNNLIKKSTDQFSVKYGKNIPIIRGNSQQLEQVIINLITNACQAISNPESSLNIFTLYNSQSKQIVLKVEDEGEGITKENLKRIMDPFFTTKQSKGGTGLGLSICYNIVKNHGGQLTFQSQKDKGTQAVLTLSIKS